MIHALECISFLKLEPQNYIQFEMSDENKIISISQESMKKTSNGDETQYDNIYNIKVHEITLRELLLF